MTTDKMPHYLTALALGLLGAIVVVVQPYSGDWMGSAYGKPARQFISAAVRQDSAGLQRIARSEAAVRWALEAGRRHGAALELWEHRMEVRTGRQRGDTAEVFVYPSDDECGHAPIVLQFVGSGGAAHVVWANSTWSQTAGPRRGGYGC
jgi:hypothetical protein